MQQAGHFEAYRECSDEEIVERIHAGDTHGVDYILEKYKNMVRQKARTLYLIGGDKEDLIQEGMIGLYKAIRGYNREKESSFATFANLCVTRQLYSAIRISNRMKYSPLNNYVALSDMEQLDAYQSPEEIMLDKEKTNRIEDELKKRLSPLEKQVMDYYINDMKYTEIAAVLGKEPKAIDNALQRIKIKLRDVLKNIEKTS
ncbi:sigma-70 family RNA polymerase sigma factor [Anaerolentibacter hominis]|uniref:sigma-70 family RNA polymerase sigma factor n=1 Tax=Anaerolentibacter hominis TaxID=3079009 RepID=UPI0031B80D7F